MENDSENERSQARTLNGVDEEEEEHNTEESIDPEIKNIMVQEDVLDYDMLRKKTVVQLKAIAEQRNLQKYKSLTKRRLIDLILN